MQTINDKFQFEVVVFYYWDWHPCLTLVIGYVKYKHTLKQKERSLALINCWMPIGYSVISMIFIGKIPNHELTESIELLAASANENEAICIQDTQTQMK